MELEKERKGKTEKSREEAETMVSFTKSGGREAQPWQLQSFWRKEGLEGRGGEHRALDWKLRFLSNTLFLWIKYVSEVTQKHGIQPAFPNQPWATQPRVLKETAIQSTH